MAWKLVCCAAICLSFCGALEANHHHRRSHRHGGPEDPVLPKPDGESLPPLVIAKLSTTAREELSQTSITDSAKWYTWQQRFPKLVERIETEGPSAVWKALGKETWLLYTDKKGREQGFVAHAMTEHERYFRDGAWKRKWSARSMASLNANLRGKECEDDCLEMYKSNESVKCKFPKMETCESLAKSVNLPVEYINHPDSFAVEEVFKNYHNFLKVNRIRDARSAWPSLLQLYKRLSLMIPFSEGNSETLDFVIQQELVRLGGHPMILQHHGDRSFSNVRLDFETGLCAWEAVYTNHNSPYAIGAQKLSDDEGNCLPGHLFPPVDKSSELEHLSTMHVPVVKADLFSVASGMAGLNLLAHLERKLSGIVFFDVDAAAINHAKLHVELIRMCDSRACFLQRFFARNPKEGRDQTLKFTPAFVHEKFFDGPFDEAVFQDTFKKLSDADEGAASFYSGPVKQALAFAKANHGIRTGLTNSLGPGESGFMKNELRYIATRRVLQRTKVQYRLLDDVEGTGLSALSQEVGHNKFGKVIVFLSNVMVASWNLDHSSLEKKIKGYFPEGGVLLETGRIAIDETIIEDFKAALSPITSRNF